MSSLYKRFHRGIFRDYREVLRLYSLQRMFNAIFHKGKEKGARRRRRGGGGGGKKERRRRRRRRKKEGSRCRSVCCSCGFHIFRILFKTIFAFSLFFCLPFVEVSLKFRRAPYLYFPSSLSIKFVFLFFFFFLLLLFSFPLRFEGASDKYIYYYYYYFFFLLFFFTNILQ